MSNYTKLINNLETLKLERIKDNVDKYIELINKKEKDYLSASYLCLGRKNSKSPQFFPTKKTLAFSTTPLSRSITKRYT